VVSDYAWLIPTLPALSAVVIMFLGRSLPKKGAEVGITVMAVCLVLSGFVAYEVFSTNVQVVADAEEAVHGGETTPADEDHARAGGLQVAAAGTVPLYGAEAEGAQVPAEIQAFVNERALPLAEFGEGEAYAFEAGQRVDGLAAMMFLLVTFVSLMVQIYSAGYMHGDPRFTYYYTMLSLFTASMLLLVIANNMMLLLVGWELVGVCSFLLIGFWWEERQNSNAAIKAFLTTKFGDVGLMVGVIGLWQVFGTFNIGEMVAAVEGGMANSGLLTFSLLMLFLGCVGKSAQFPLHTWLPDAMAGPTPVSALIHAATMVTAGVFLIARLYPVFSVSPQAKATIAIIGAITLFSAGLLAVVQDDIKKVLAYSTVSQLGYMVAALAFSYTAGIFHLFTHGFFKALLFLGAGSLIHSAHSNNMSDMGGLRRAMPTTWWTFLIGSLALMAVPVFAGFWSKDEILVAAAGAGGYTGWVVFALGALGGLVTAFYMTRALWLIFAGDFRGHGHPHESPRTMTGPLVALAVPAALIGFINLPFPGVHTIGFAAWTSFSPQYFVDHPIEFNLIIALIATLLAAAGIGIGTLLYRRVPERDPMLRMGLATTVLQNKYYLDDLYEGVVVPTFRDRLAAASYWLNDNVIDRAVYLTGAGMSRLGKSTYDVDQKGIDGAVNGIGGGMRWFGGVMKTAQSGNVQLYAGAMFVGVVVLGILFATAA
jgi:NADH-quinone oxidoreductase subunit L